MGYMAGISLGALNGYPPPTYKFHLVKNEQYYLSYENFLNGKVSIILVLEPK